MKWIEIFSDILPEPLPLDGSICAFAKDISQEVLDILACGDFMRLESKIFAFANDLAAKTLACAVEAGAVGS
jgi:hypothetical protein